MPSKGATLTEERVGRYIALTAEALKKLKVAAPERSFNRTLADDFLKMARAYFEDARDFESKGDLVNAFACINYAHGWLDCGARMGLFDVGGDERLFTLYS
ncbi:MAG: hypothetical protein A3K67_00125 [Euryarchaeota archaeon RBG_16_62_10]|nr:MAG: hypothetical protein A3K67_00125 [Euryarchaeota archaeon RBG_16_62_10]